MWFEDEDVDFDDKNIIISRRGINNGDIINITSNELIFEFTQNDILKKEIAFRHRGLSYDQFVFWAKDGAHSTASMMRVQARVRNPSGFATGNAPGLGVRGTPKLFALTAHDFFGSKLFFEPLLQLDHH